MDPPVLNAGFASWVPVSSFERPPASRMWTSTSFIVDLLHRDQDRTVGFAQQEELADARVDQAMQLEAEELFGAVVSQGVVATLEEPIAALGDRGHLVPVHGVIRDLADEASDV